MTSTTHQKRGSFHLARIIANVPGVLGFYPDESVVLIALDRAQGRTSLGPIARIDAHRTQDLAAAVSFIEASGFPVFIAVLVSAQLEVEKACDGPGGTGAVRPNPRCEAVLSSLEDACCSAATTCLGAWGCDEIYSGAPYVLLKEFGERGPEFSGGLWESGRVEDIVSSESARHLLQHGLLPELTREDTFNRFASQQPCLNNKSLVSAAADVESELKGGGVPAFESLRNCFDERIAAVAPFLTRGQALPQGEIEYFALFCSSILLRDCIADRCFDASPEDARAMSAVWLHVARHTPTHVRSQALTLLALAELSVGNNAVATPAVNLAIAEDPSNTFAPLVREVLLRNCADAAEKACRRATDSLRKRFAA